MQTDSKPRQIEVEEDQTEADVSEIHVKGNEKEMLLKQLHDQKKLKANHQLTSDSRESEKQPTDENTGQSSTHGHSESVFVSPEIRNVIAKEYDLADVGVDHHHLSDGKKKHKGRKSSKIKPEEENGAGHKARHEEEKQEMYYFDMSPAVKVPKAMMEKAVGTMKSVARGMEKHRPTFSDLGAKLKLTEKPKEVPAEKPKEESSIKTALSISTITVKEANKYSFLRNEKRRDVSVYENKFEEAGESDFDLFTGREESPGQAPVDMAKLDELFSLHHNRKAVDHQKPATATTSPIQVPSKEPKRPKTPHIKKKKPFERLRTLRFRRQGGFSRKTSKESIKDNDAEKGKHKEKENEKMKEKHSPEEDGKRHVGLLRKSPSKRRSKSAESTQMNPSPNKSLTAMDRGGLASYSYSY